MLAWIAFLAACISHQEDGAALFRRAVLTQTPEGRAPVIRDFQADLEISFYDVDEKGAHKATRSGTITEFWKSKPGGDLYHRILKSDRTTHLCANAKGYFLWEDEAGGRARDLSVPELKQDYDQLQEELHRTRELLDAEDAAFDELEHAYEEGDRAHYEQDLVQWRALVERRAAFLDRHGLFPVATT